MEKCPLCFNTRSLKKIEGPDSRSYRACNNCMLIFAESHFLPSEESERKRYLTHDNSIHNKGYVKFLNQAIEPALPYLNKNMHGLDFGCGPVPVLSAILKQKGFSSDYYDPIFFPEIHEQEYDYIFATESFEHFFQPPKEINMIRNLLKPGGLLIVMTEKWKSHEAFANWYYATDFTHVVFYHEKTLEFIALHFGFKLQKSDNDRVDLLQKHAAQ